MKNRITLYLIAIFVALTVIGFIVLRSLRSADEETAADSGSLESSHSEASRENQQDLTFNEMDSNGSTRARPNLEVYAPEGSDSPIDIPPGMENDIRILTTAEQQAALAQMEQDMVILTEEEQKAALEDHMKDVREVPDDPDALPPTFGP